MRDVVGLVLCVALSIGCQSGVTMSPSGGSAAPPVAAQPARAPSAAPDRGGSAAVVTAAEPPAAAPPAADAAPAAPTHIQLPKSSDKPVRRTTRPLNRAQLGRIAAVEFPDFVRQDRSATDRLVEFRHTTRTRPKLEVAVTLGPCPRPRACPSMQLATWRARRAALLGELPKTLAARADTRFEIGWRKVAGVPVITIYELGYSGGTDKDQPSADYIDAYVVYYNDGVNQVRVMAHYVDDSLGGVDQLLAVAPPEDLEKLAVAFAGYYLHAWN